MFPRVLGLLGAVSLSMATAMSCKRAAGPEGPPAAPPGRPELPTARAVLQSAAGSEVRGQVTFEQTSEGVRVHVEADGLTPGQHGFHVHERGDCSAPDFSSAGEHYAPQGHPHGPPGPTSHAGDLGNVEADAAGHVDQTIVTQYLLPGQELRAIAGRSVILHARPDDFTSQPSGASGDRVACGVIELAGER